jgi:excisionase family DNA binding protein
MAKEVMNFQEVLEYLTISRGTLFRLMKDNQLAYVKAGKRLLFRKQDIDAYLEAHLVPAKKPSKPPKK